ncbi:MAG: ribosome-associated protein [Gammaproteobacteria bacterium]|jgi:ribosome-associated protein
MQPEALKAMVLAALEDIKANDVVVLDVSPYASFTDYMVFASGTSSRHVSSIAGSVIDEAKKQNSPPLGIEGLDVGDWVLVDLGDVVVHVMLPATREFYELEKLWGEEMADAGLSEDISDYE